MRYIFLGCPTIPPGMTKEWQPSLLYMEAELGHLWSPFLPDLQFLAMSPYINHPLNPEWFRRDYAIGESSCLLETKKTEHKKEGFPLPTVSSTSTSFSLLLHQIVIRAAGSETASSVQTRAAARSRSPHYWCAALIAFVLALGKHPFLWNIKSYCKNYVPDIEL